MPRRRTRLALLLTTHEGTSRLEALSDGVFAIAATLLVVDLKVPLGISDSSELLGTLASQWPTYVSYVMSFVYLGIYWSHHVRIFSYFRRTDHVFLKLNVLFLMMLALLPFPTALIGTYGTTHDERARTALLVYAGSLLITASLFSALWLYATYKRRLVDPDLPDDVVEANTARYLVGPIGYAIAFVVAWWSPLASAILIILAALFYLLPIHLTTRD
jgi:uncharacterized membrane protein